MLSTQPLGCPTCPDLTAEERRSEPEVRLNTDPLSNQPIKALSAVLRKEARDTLDACDPQNDLTGGHGGDGRFKVTKPYTFEPSGALEVTYSNLFILKMRKLGPRERR